MAKLCCKEHWMVIKTINKDHLVVSYVKSQFEPSLDSSLCSYCPSCGSGVLHDLMFGLSLLSVCSFWPLSSENPHFIPEHFTNNFIQHNAHLCPFVFGFSIYQTVYCFTLSHFKSDSLSLLDVIDCGALNLCRPPRPDRSSTHLAPVTQTQGRPQEAWRPNTRWRSWAWASTRSGTQTTHWLLKWL